MLACLTANACSLYLQTLVTLFMIALQMLTPFYKEVFNISSPLLRNGQWVKFH